MDSDLEERSRDELVAEVMRLRDAIRKHRDASGHDLCWYQPDLWSLLPEERDRVPLVPEWPQFMRGCVRFRQSLDLQAGSARVLTTSIKGCSMSSTLIRYADRPAR